MQPWKVRCSAVSAGEFEHQVDFIRGAAFVLYRERFRLGVHVQGASPPGMLVVSLPLRLGPRTRYWRKPLLFTGLPSCLSGAVDVEFGPGHDQVVALIDLTWLSRRLPPESVEALTHGAETKYIALPPAAMQRFGVWMTELLMRVRADPSLSHYSAVMSMVEDELLEQLRSMARYWDTVGYRPRVIRRKRALDLSLQFLYEVQPDQLSVHDLCRRAGVSQRNLELVFRETFNLSPAAFLRYWQLHRARRELLIADPEEDSVTHIALRNGFYHLGRFSTQYRALFGEKPSRTLQRRVTGATPIDLCRLLPMAAS